MRSKRHQWHNWEQYQTVHDNTIATYLGHFIMEDGLERVETPRSVVWAGILLCADAVEIKVDKRQDVRTHGGRLEVRTIDYSYHAYLRLGGDGVRNLLRYDNAHPHPDHPDSNHKHEYDDRGRDHVAHIGGDWPTLGQVIAEVHAWWMANVQK